MGTVEDALPKPRPPGTAEAESLWSQRTRLLLRPGAASGCPQRAGRARAHGEEPPGGRACVAPWEPRARGRSARRGRRAAAQPAQRGSGPAPPLGLSLPRGGRRAPTARGVSVESGVEVGKAQGRRGRQEPGSRGGPYPNPRGFSDVGQGVPLVRILGGRRPSPTEAQDTQVPPLGG